MAPTQGRIVKYKLTAADRDKLSAYNKTEVFSNMAEELPAIITAVWSEDSVNIKVFVDGNAPDLWVTSISQGDEEGNWNWFPRV